MGEKNYKIGELLTLPDGVRLEVCSGKNCEHCYFKEHKDLLCPNCGGSVGYFDGPFDSNIIFVEKHNF